MPTFDCLMTNGFGPDLGWALEATGAHPEIRRGIDPVSRDFDITVWHKFKPSYFTGRTDGIIVLYNGLGPTSPYDILTVFHNEDACYVGGYPTFSTVPIPGVFLNDKIYHKFNLSGQLSTVAADIFIQDGNWKFSVDDTLIVNATGVYLYPRNQMYHNQGTLKYSLWNEFGIKPQGYVSCLRVAKTACGDDPSTPCCCSGGGPGPGGDPGPGTGTPPGTKVPDPADPLPAWTSSCLGGGLVPTLADLTAGESLCD